MLLFLVRHGETEYNRLGLALGRKDVPLNEAGLRQVQCLAEALAEEQFAAIYSSPLARALDTARAIAGRRGLEVQVEPGLIEMEIGEVEGLSFEQVRERFPELAQNWGGRDGPAYRMPGSSERLIDVQARALSTVEQIVSRHGADDAVCAVSHNFWIVSLLASVLGIDLAHFRRVRHGLAAISVIEVRPGRTRVVRLNDVCHLQAVS